MNTVREVKKTKEGNFKKRNGVSHKQTVHLLPETRELLNKLLLEANGSGKAIVKVRHILQRAVEKFPREELKALFEELKTPEMRFEEEFQAWVSENPGKSVKDFNSYLVGLHQQMKTTSMNNTKKKENTK